MCNKKYKYCSYYYLLFHQFFEDFTRNIAHQGSHGGAALFYAHSTIWGVSTSWVENVAEEENGGALWSDERFVVSLDLSSIVFILYFSPF